MSVTALNANGKKLIKSQKLAECGKTKEKHQKLNLIQLYVIYKRLSLDAKTQIGRK